MWIAIAATVIACGSQRRYIDDSPEGRACARQCMLVANTCPGDEYSCRAQYNACVSTCPGYHVESKPGNVKAQDTALAVIVGAIALGIAAGAGVCTAKEC